MIERPSRFSVSTPSAFIATSDIPEVAPYTKSAQHSVTRSGARPGRARESVHSASSTRSAARAPRRWLMRPASGMASAAPSAGKARARPSVPAPSPAWSWIQGMRVAKEPVTAPWVQNTAAMAHRAWRRRAGLSSVSPVMFMKLSGSLPDD